MDTSQVPNLLSHNRNSDSVFLLINTYPNQEIPLELWMKPHLSAAIIVKECNQVRTYPSPPKGRQKSKPARLPLPINFPTSKKKKKNHKNKIVIKGYIEKYIFFSP